MSTFRTVLNIPSFPLSIQHQDKLFCMGSCFAEHIGQRLSTLKFPIVLNPFGILYNPLSIARALQILLEKEEMTADILFEYQGLWHSPIHHSRFSGLSKKEVWDNILAVFNAAKEHFQTSKTIILTFGTAFVYEDKKTKEVFANCHKLPAHQFRKRRLSVAEIVNHFKPLLKQVIEQQSNLNIILTLSPVRHIRDGIIENQRSKATLSLAIEEICQQVEPVHYFPAYELVLDDLRDYRFFAADMVHPNATAIDYVWAKFGTAFFKSKTPQLIRQIEKIIKASQHRPFQPKSAAHQLFVKKQLEKIAQLEQQYPFLNFSKEKKLFTTIL